MTDFIYFLRKVKKIPHLILQYMTRPIVRERSILAGIILNNKTTENPYVLDFGCGEGVIAPALKKIKGVEYITVDNDIYGLLLGKCAFGINHSICANERLPFKENIFDFVILSNVLHHLSNEKVLVLLRAIKKSLRPGGSLVITELATRDKQKGLFFCLVTYLEELLKKIQYRDSVFLKSFMQFGFCNPKIINLNKNFNIYLFSSC